jgi:hypothetical protein
MKDMWICLLIFLVFVACYEAKHLDIPDKAEQVPIVSNSTIDIAEPTPSSCEIEVQMLRDEASEWQHKYLEFQCDCGDNYDLYE